MTAGQLCLFSFFLHFCEKIVAITITMPDHKSFYYVSSRAIVITYFLLILASPRGN